MEPVKFQSRIDAGQKIAERLIGLKLDLLGESGSQDIAVLAVPRGGIIIGDIDTIFPVSLKVSSLVDGHIIG